MISNIGKNPYLQINNDRKIVQVNKTENINETTTENNRVNEIRKALEDGSYKLIPAKALAKVFAEAELLV